MEAGPVAGVRLTMPAQFVKLRLIL
jgi:hypothetical protein